MEYTGLTIKYPVNRALTDRERAHQLKQKVRAAAEPVYQLSVIRLNSTFLELVDKFYAWKGVGTTLLGIVILGVSWVIGQIVLDAIRTSGQPDGQPLWFLVSMVGMFGCVLAACAWLLRKESFAYTHYPIRFNRKTRMVHVFRIDGSILSVKWDDVFFCIVDAGQGFSNVVGHVLDKDGSTVRETFPLPAIAGSSQVDLEHLRTYWEFLRRYMEEGPKDAVRRVEFFLPIADRRETIWDGFHRMHAEGGTNFAMSIIFAALAIVVAPGRWFAMRTSKIAQWPDSIESISEIEQQDPFVRHVA